MQKKKYIVAEIIKVDNTMVLLYNEMDTPFEDRAHRMIDANCPKDEIVDPDVHAESPFGSVFARDRNVTDLMYELKNNHHRLTALFNYYLRKTCKEDEWYIKWYQDFDAAKTKHFVDYDTAEQDYFLELNNYVKENLSSQVGIERMDNIQMTVGLVEKEMHNEDGSYIRNKLKFGLHFNAITRSTMDSPNDFYISYGTSGSFKPTKDLDRVLFLEILSKFSSNSEMQQFVCSKMKEFGAKLDSLYNEYQTAQENLVNRLDAAAKKLPIYTQIFAEYAPRMCTFPVVDIDE